MASFTTGLQATSGWPVHFFVGGSGSGTAASQDITAFVDVPTIRIEETGNQEPATLSFDFLETPTSVPSNAVASQFAKWIVPEGHVYTRHGTIKVFEGLIRQMRPSIFAISRRITCTCHSASSLMDKSIIDVKSRRTNGESDKARIQWLLSTYAPAYAADFGNWDDRYIQALNASMPNQTFQNLSMRQAIERVLGSASPTANYYWDAVGRLHTWDATHPESANPSLSAPDQSTFTAPYEVNATHQPAAGEIAPEDLLIEWDTSNLVNFYKVRGKTTNGTLTIADSDSVHTYGRRDAYIDAPDADTVAKGQAVGLAALSDTKDPTVRGSFSVQGSSVINGGSRWMPGQTVYVTSPQHGILHHGYRIVRVTTTYLSSMGDRRQEIEFGGLRRRLRDFGAS